MSDWIVLGVAAWIACGILTYGIAFGYFQRKFALIADETIMADRIFAAVFGLCGPVGLVTSYFLSGFAKHGLKYR